MLNETFLKDLDVICYSFNGSYLYHYGIPNFDLPAGESALVFKHQMSNGTYIFQYANGTVETSYEYWVVLNSWNDSDCNYTERQSGISAYC